MTAAAPIATFIVPGRDIAEFAPAAVQSLRAQSETRWHALLIDDGSLDRTGEIFDAAAANDSRFAVIHHPQSIGLGAARNRALSLVDTRYLGFLDADDELTYDALRLMSQTLNRTKSAFVAAAYVRSRFDGSRYVAGRVQPWVSRATNPAADAATLATRPAASGNIVAWSKLSRTDFWRAEDLRFAEGAAYEDQVVAQQMYTRAPSFDVIPDVVVRWRIRADRTSLTQRTAQTAVLRDYLHALDGGLDVLHAADATDALSARLHLILSMDIPPLARLAESHEDASYRRELDAFLDRLQRFPGIARVQPDPGLADALAW